MSREEARRKGHKFEAILLGRRMESLERAARGVGAKGIDEAIGHGILQEKGRMSNASRVAAQAPALSTQLRVHCSATCTGAHIGPLRFS
ncbi:unnamed protein product [marine sediment metagenome]|uniref:Uncharacterized protein n=1 Tax=marine sediment metagenome TaxID=412755 RepID=X0WG74_9ZZZZ